MTYLNKLWILFTFQTPLGSFPGPSSKSRKFKERHDFMSRWKQLEHHWRHGAMVQIVGSFDGRALEWVMNPPEPQQTFSLDMKRELLLGKRCVKFMSHLCWNGSNCGIVTHFHLQKKNIWEKTKKIEGVIRQDVCFSPRPGADWSWHGSESTGWMRSTKLVTEVAF